MGLLFLSGCNYVVLENPLPTVQDNRIVGSWATPDGKLYAVIKPGDNSAYQSLSADDITKGASGTIFYLAKAGGTLLALGIAPRLSALAVAGSTGTETCSWTIRQPSAVLR